VSQVRRTAFAFYYLGHDPLAEAVALLRGEERSAGDAEIFALAILTGERHAVSRGEFELLMSLPAERWVTTAGLDDRMVASLADKGLLVSDSEDPRDETLRSRDDALAGNYWNLYGALFHYMTQWNDVCVDLERGEDGAGGMATAQSVREFLSRYGPPPSPFAERGNGRKVPLPNVEHDSQLYQTLLDRRTVRDFDADSSMKLEELSTILRYVFGYHGYAETAPEVVCMRRTSPSGGALHPVEAYPLITNVAGVEPGIYHYNCRDHSLGLVEALDREDGSRLATSFMCGQSDFGRAHVTFVLTARFGRNHWKYRWHQKAYPAILMDAAHLSQTLYLVSTELGLGPFVTLAINGRDIEARLGLDGVNEGVIAMTGCGVVRQRPESPPPRSI
jgi:putative peptide maturation dehydrogenase